MSRAPRLCLPFFALVLIALGAVTAPARAQAPARLKITSINIRHVGPRTISDELVFANIRVQPGDPFSELNIKRDIQNLYATRYFYNIRVTEERQADGVALTYFVQANPTLSDIRFEGNKVYSQARLEKKITS